MEFTPVLIEREDKASCSVIASSAVLIERKYVLATSNILGPFFDQHQTLLKKLETGKMHLYTRKSLKCRVLWKYGNEKGFTSKNANMFALFKSNQLEEFCKNDFKDWTVDFRENNINLKEYLSVFLIFGIENELIEEENFKSIIFTWVINILHLNINKCDRILCHSTPFGNRDFLNSLSEGIISTTLKESTLYLSDCSSTPGCEGGLVYLKAKLDFPVGILISSFNWWRKEWVGFTLLADIRPIISQLVSSVDKATINNSQPTTLSKLVATSENCLAQVNCGANWGTAILLSKEKGIFLTNSHVIRKGLKIRLFWRNKLTYADLNYQASNECALDLAILKTIEHFPFMSSPELDIVCCNKGDTVYCAGYPLLSTSAKPEGVTITHGIISASERYMLKTTCGVYPGFSGGAVFSSTGFLLGIIVCNTKLQDTETTYPKYNMAIPFGSISHVISEYINTEEIQALTYLDSVDIEATSTWSRLQGKL